MARANTIAVVLSILSVAALARAGSGFAESNPIRTVVDRVDSLERSLFFALGWSPHAFHFARFSRRYGKSYGSVEEIKLRFGIFVENLELIRSTNRKGLPYKLGINRFADISWDEFRARRHGAARNRSATPKGTHKLRCCRRRKTGGRSG